LSQALPMVTSLGQFPLQHAHRGDLRVAPAEGNRVLALLVFVASLLAASAVRVGDNEQLSEERKEAGDAAWQNRWLAKVQMWCSYNDEILQCDQDSVILVDSAFYNRQHQANCLVQRDPQPMVDCKPNVTEKVVAACNGHMRCMIPGAKHAACPDSPFTKIRVRYECVANPKAGIEDAGHLVKDVGQVATQTLATIRVEAANSHILQRYPIGCWRFTVSDRLLSLRYPLHRTTCLWEEECFKVFFPGDHRFRNIKYPPTVQYLVQGELVEGSNGLQKNDDHTWGVCLPKKGKGSVYAKMYFYQLKIENAHLIE